MRLHRLECDAALRLAADLCRGVTARGAPAIVHLQGLGYGALVPRLRRLLPPAAAVDRRGFGLEQPGVLVAGVADGHFLGLRHALAHVLDCDDFAGGQDAFQFVVGDAANRGGRDIDWRCGARGVDPELLPSGCVPIEG